MAFPVGSRALESGDESRQFDYGDAQDLSDAGKQHALEEQAKHLKRQKELEDEAAKKDEEAQQRDADEPATGQNGDPQREEAKQKRKEAEEEGRLAAEQGKQAGGSGGAGDANGAGKKTVTDGPTRAERAEDVPKISSAESPPRTNANQPAKIPDSLSKVSSKDLFNATGKIQTPDGSTFSNGNGGYKGTGMATEAQMKGSTVTTPDGQVLQYQGIQNGAHTWGTGNQASSFVDLDGGGQGTQGTFQPASSFRGGTQFSNQQSAITAAQSQFNTRAGGSYLDYGYTTQGGEFVSRNVPTSPGTYSQSSSTTVSSAARRIAPQRGIAPAPYGRPPRLPPLGVHQEPGCVPDLGCLTLVY